jgi:iron complex transport system ATP-binding protein
MKLSDLKIQRKPPFVVAFEGEISINGSTILGVYGPNGAGKSSLMKGLAALLPPHQRSGFVLIGTEMFDLSRVGPEWARTVLYLGSEMRPVFSVKVRDLLELAAAVSRGGVHLELTSAERTRIAQVCEAMGLVSQLNRSIDEMSDGERQWVMIARGLVQQPKLLLLDETCSKLDLDRWAQLIQVLRSSLTERMCIWICSHELPYLMSLTDQVLVFADRLELWDTKNVSALELGRKIYPSTPVEILRALLGVV